MPMTDAAIDMMRPDFKDRNIFEKMKGRITDGEIKFDDWEPRDTLTAGEGSETYICLTTDGSYPSCVGKKLGFTYKWSTRPIQPKEGPGNKTMSTL